MIINNKEISTRIRLGLMLVILVWAVIIVLSLIFSWSKNHILEFVVTIAFILFMSYAFTRKYCYIIFNNEGPKVIIRFSPLQPLSAGHYSIEFYKKDFYKYELVKSFFGLRETLIIYVKTPQGIAKYKPVSLATLTAKEKEDIIGVLDNYSKQAF